MALDVIKQVGPGEVFLTHRHTLKRFRKEHWFPTIIDRWKEEAWIERGSKSLYQRANEKVRNIVASHVPVPLSGEVRLRLEGIIRDAEREWVKQAYP